MQISYTHGPREPEFKIKNTKILHAYSHLHKRGGSYTDVIVCVCLYFEYRN